MSIFYDNPRLTVLATFLIALVGAVAYGGLARQEDPTMTERYATVSTFLPGATASRVESLVSEPLETRLREVPEVRTLRSNSRAGYSLLNVELHDHVGPEQTDVVWSELRDKLAEAHPLLPAGTSVPLLDVRGPIATTLVVALTWDAPGEVQLGMLTRLAEALRIRLANLPNTRESTLYGAADEQLLVAVPPHALADAGLTAADLSIAIAAADTKRPAGRLQQSGADLLVEIDAELDSAERIARIPLRQDGSGAMLRVGDVATVRKVPADPPEALALVGGLPAVFVGTTMEPDSNI
ncbi:MAG: efflux RND transporter permease subunit, partial [Pseudomonadales bacterium]